MSPLLQATDVRKVFHGRDGGGQPHDFVAVKGISFSLRAGESLAIVGESGSGKTTMARMIAGLEPPSRGAVLFDGLERPTGRLRKDDRLEWARRIQMVFQDPFSSLDPLQTVEDALTEVLRIHFPSDVAARDGRVTELLESVGLQKRHRDRRPRGLSGGERQRVAIARALAVNPRLIILDESVSALDVSVQAHVLNLLSDLRERLNVAYLFISHDLAVVRQVSDRCIVMHQGAVVEEGTTDSVLSGPREAYTRQLIDAIPRAGWKPARRARLEAVEID